VKNNKWKDQLLTYEIIVPITMIIFVVVLIIDVYDLPKVAKRAPLLVGFITLALLFIQTCISIVKNLKDTEKIEKIKISGNLIKDKALQLLLIMILYGVAMYSFGFFPSTIVMLPITMWMVGEKDVIKIILASGIFLIIFYVVFIKVFGLKPLGGAFL
jgi:hypothetical protein